jgi:RimJ/RimL family protein N-acetyltransferase
MLNADWQIRPLAAQDAAAFQALRLQAIADSPTAVWPTAGEEGALTIEEVAGRIAGTSGVTVFGAFAAGELVAIAGLRRETLAQVAHKALLWGVFVAPRYRGAGLARALVGTALAHARETGILQVRLCVNTANQRARGLYAVLGFRSLGIEPRAMRLAGRFYDEEHMVLQLDEAAAHG